MKILLAGSGDIAQRIPPKLSGQHQFFGLKRRPINLSNGITPLIGDLTDVAYLDRVFREGFDVVVATLTPDSATEEGYQKAYVDSSAALCLAINNADHKPKLVIWVSSTSVYGQSSGSWVDEDSPANSATFSGRALLQAAHICPALHRCSDKVLWNIRSWSHSNARSGVSGSRASRSTGAVE